MTNLRTSIVVDLTGNLERRARQYAQTLDGFSRSGQRSMTRLSRLASATGRGLDFMGNRYTALLAGGAAVGLGNMLVGLETRFVRLGIQSNKSAEEISALKDEIFDLAQAPDIRVDPGEITAAIEAIVEKTGDLAFARDNIRNIGVAIQATGAAGSNIGEILGEFQKMGIRGPQEILEVLDTLNKQGKEGAFTLQNLAALGPRVITAYTATGRSGPQALREMGAALQMIRMGTGSSEMAATAFEALLRTLTDPEKIKQLQKKAGISVFDPEKLKEGQKVLRPINELMTEIIKKTKGDRTKLGLIFDAEAVRAFNQAGGEFLRTGRLDTLEKFMQIYGDGADTLKDSTRAAKTASSAMTNLATAWKQFADGNLTQPIQDLADTLNSLEPGTVQRWMTIGKWVAIAGGAAILARKATNLLGGAAGVASAAVTTGAVGITIAAVAPAAVAGWWAGQKIYDNLSDETQNTIGGTIATILANLGNKEAQRALDADMNARAGLGASNVSGKISIEVDDKRVRVNKARSDNPNVDYEIESGLTMGAP